ncbi:hypothetical protein BaOVIS_021250 [Babesia ovis]|uniref:Uncharacterized protein n=1 Tax=Babesia ovis TaxID=5869 RepID=A0A9W5TBP3_BABOV|nr:hypothetical protein BaOVIS_021250 [Babesia ovis]
MCIPRLYRKSSFLVLHCRWKATEVTHYRNSGSQVPVVNQRLDISRYKFPSDPDALLVDPNRLKRGERVYQKLSIVFPAIAFTVALSIPLGLATVFWLTSGARNKGSSKSADGSASASFTSSLPPLLTAKDLQKLVYAKTPTIVVYFFPGGSDEEANRVNLHSVVLKEISSLSGSPLNVFRLDAKEQFHNLNPFLKEEIKRSPGLLIHAVIPSENESSVISVLPPVSVQSFVRHLSRLLETAGIKFSKDDPGVRTLDQQLARVKRCIFDLTIEGKLRFLDGQSLDLLEQQCTKLLGTTTSR